MTQKFRRKVQDLRALTNSTKGEASALAKVTKVVRLKRKRVLLRGPNRELIGSLSVQGDMVILRLKAEAAVQMLDERTLTVSIPPKKEKKKKVQKSQETPVDNKHQPG